MNYQEALESGVEYFWAKNQFSDWHLFEQSEVVEYKEQIELMGDDPKSGALIYQFLPILTADQLLGAVEKSVVELFTFHSDCVDAVDLDELSFNPGDQVIIMRTPLEHGKVTQEGEK
jgi:hypothetical protein